MGLLNELRERIVGLEAERTKYWESAETERRLKDGVKADLTELNSLYDDLTVKIAKIEAERDKLKEQALHHNTICEGLENHVKRVGEKADRLRELVADAVDSWESNDVQRLDVDLKDLKAALAETEVE